MLQKAWGAIWMAGRQTSSPSTIILLRRDLAFRKVFNPARLFNDVVHWVQLHI